MARLKEIVIDARDPPRLARFWAAALDGYALRDYDDAEIARLAALGFTPDTDPAVAVDGPGPTLFFQFSDRGVGLGRMHLDLVGGRRQAVVARLEALGARVRDEHEHHTVMLDPEGNRFCVQDPSPIRHDQDRAGYGTVAGASRPSADTAERRGRCSVSAHDTFRNTYYYPDT